MDVTSVQFTVGKLDAGMAILLSPNHDVVEIPSSMLPDGVAPGNILNITIDRNEDEEKKQQEDFLALQEEIHQVFTQVPKTPVVEMKSATQTSVIIQWPTLVLYAAQFKGVDVYKNGQKLNIALNQLSTSCKLSGLDMNQEYQVWIVLKTSAGSFTSNKIMCKTHALDNLTGLNPSFGTFTNDAELEALIDLMSRIGGGWTEDLSSENTHLVCTVAKGPKYERALELNIPIVTPEFLKACEQQGKIQPAHTYYVQKK